MPIPSRVAEQLEALVLGSRYREPDNLVFPGYCRTVPLDKHRIQNAFYSALKGIGIDEAVRRERGLVSHSTRHTFNSLMRGKIDGGKLMRIVAIATRAPICATSIPYPRIWPRSAAYRNPSSPS